MVETFSDGGFQFAEEVEISGETSGFDEQLGHEGAIVQSMVGEGRRFGPGAVDAFALGVDAIGHAAVGALALDEVADGLDDIVGVEEVSGLFDHVGEVACPKGAIVSDSIGSVHPCSVGGLDTAALELLKSGIAKPIDVFLRDRVLEALAESLSVRWGGGGGGSLDVRGSAD